MHAGEDEAPGSEDKANASSENNAAGKAAARRTTKKWYVKVAEKVLVIAINYAQGMLALRGLRMAAEDRDRRMPKFPIF